jgi:hypothetical protein
MKSDRMRNESRRRWLEAAVAAGILLPGGMAALIGRALAQGAAKQGVQRLRGTVQVNGQPAKKGTLVAPGDTVTTGARSYATFVVGEDAFLVRGDTQLELSGAGTLVNVFRLVTGKLLSVYSKGPPRELRGATGTIGIRGTAAYMETGAERTYFCLCYGEAEIVPTAAPEQRESVRTIHHDQPRFIYAAGRERVIERAPVINHRDAELILLESLVGRAPPFVDTDEYRSGVRY